MVILDFLSNNFWILGVAIFIGVGFFGIKKREKHHKHAKKSLEKTVKSGMTEPMTLHPEIDPKKCGGCGACTQVCPEGDILRLINHKAVLVGPSKCVGHGECEAVCPFGAIDLVFGTKTRGVEIPRVSTDYETNVPGLYIAGELGGMGLIRNAMKQGTYATEHAIKNIKTNQKTDCDILIVGSGPAGMACGLTAILHKKSYICIEQNTFGGTVYNFPRQKIVMTHPADVPGYGKMTFPNNKVSKEQLLEYWNGLRKKSGMEVKENTKFENLEKIDDYFKVVTTNGTFTAKKVIMCMGVRGSPRKLGVKNEESAKVAYSLIDPEQYKRQHVGVVGAGNAALEAAQMLGQKKYGNTVTLLVRGPVMDRCNEENKNIILKMEKEGLVKIWYDAEVKEIFDSKIIAKRGNETLDLENNFLFIFAGAEMPFKFLMSLGIMIDKLFGERKAKSS
ncbi:MAG: NAD(P)-binding domain-containing protein [Bdellovibrionales bacterium]